MYIYIYIFCTCVELAESKQCVVGIILNQNGQASLNHQISKDLKRVSHFRSVFLLPAMASSSLDATSLVASADVVSVASLPEAMEVDAPPSTVDSELLSESSFQLVGDLAEITNEDYQLAEQVAETYKNNEDATSLTLSRRSRRQLRWTFRSRSLSLPRQCNECSLRTPLLLAARVRGPTLRPLWNLRR